MRLAAAYIRVSTEEQTEYSPDAQLVELRRYAEANGLTLLPAHIYRDEGISGRSAGARPAFQEMIGAARRRPAPFEVILVWKFSRFARNREDSIVYKSMLRKAGVEVVSVTEPTGDDKTSVLMEAMLEAMDEYYSLNLAEETRRGLAEKARRGESVPRPPLGYRAGGGALEVVPGEAAAVREMFALYQGGMGLFAIARRMNAQGHRSKGGAAFTTARVRYILTNPLYKGHIRWNPRRLKCGGTIYKSDGNTICVRGRHEPIIDEVTFDAVQEELRRRGAGRRPYAKPAEVKRHYLSGTLVCSACGGGMRVSRHSSGAMRFQCVSYMIGQCKVSHAVVVRKVEEALLEGIAGAIGHGVPATRVRRRDDQAAALEAEAASIRRVLARAREAYLAGADTLEQYAATSKRLQAELSALEARIEGMKVGGEALAGLGQRLVGLGGILQDPAASLEEKHDAVRSVIEKIVYVRAEQALDIYWHLT